MGGRRRADTAPTHPPPDPTSAADDNALSRGTTRNRVLLYTLVGFWAGSEAETNWRDILARNTTGTITTGVLLVGFLVVLALMWRHDKRRGRFGGDR